MKHAVLAVVCGLALSASTAYAQGGGPKGNGAPKGKFEKFLLVAPGNPNTTQTDLTNFLKNDTSNGRAIFIPGEDDQGPERTLLRGGDGTGRVHLGETAEGEPR